MSTNHSSADHHFALASTIASEALKAVLLVNGGAVTALIALSGNTGIDYRKAILWFGIATLLAALTFTLGYFSQLSYANHILELEKQTFEQANCELKKHRAFQFIALIVLVASLAFSGYVAYVASQIALK